MRSGKQQHLYNPITIHLLQEATRTGNYELFKQYSEALDDEKKRFHLRGLMEFKYRGKAGSTRSGRACMRDCEKI